MWYGMLSRSCSIFVAWFCVFVLGLLHFFFCLYFLCPWASPHLLVGQGFHIIESLVFGVIASLVCLGRRSSGGSMINSQPNPALLGERPKGAQKIHNEPSKLRKGFTGTCCHEGSWPCCKEVPLGPAVKFRQPTGRKTSEIKIAEDYAFFFSNEKVRAQRAKHRSLFSFWSKPLQNAL